MSTRMTINAFRKRYPGFALPWNFYDTLAAGAFWDRMAKLGVHQVAAAEGERSLIAIDDLDRVQEAHAIALLRQLDDDDDPNEDFKDYLETAVRKSVRGFAGARIDERMRQCVAESVHQTLDGMVRRNQIEHYAVDTVEMGNGRIDVTVHVRVPAMPEDMDYGLTIALGVPTSWAPPALYTAHDEVLDRLAEDRGWPRQPGETDAALRDRLVRSIIK